MSYRNSAAALTALLLLTIGGGATACMVAAEGEAPALNASLSPERLGRKKPRPITLKIGFTVPPQEDKIPALNAIRFGISRRISFHAQGLPSCSLQTLFSSYGKESCGRSLVGHGFVISEITLPEQTPTMVYGKAKAYYSFNREQARILVRVETGEPLPLTYVIPFEIRSVAAPYPTSMGVVRMRAIRGICAKGHPNCFSQPYRLQGIYSQISELQLVLHRRFNHDGRRDSFVSAECAMPDPQKEATFPLATMTLLYPDQVFTGAQSARCEATS